MAIKVDQRTDEYEITESVVAKCGNVEIRPIRPGGPPWMCEVLIDGVKQEHATAVTLDIQAAQVPKLVVTRNVFNSESEPIWVQHPKERQVAESEVGNG